MVKSSSNVRLLEVIACVVKYYVAHKNATAVDGKIITGKRTQRVNYRDLPARFHGPEISIPNFEFIVSERVQINPDN